MPTRKVFFSSGVTAERPSTSKHSPESRAKISAARLGRKHSAETIAKMSAQRRGRKHSPETRAKISAKLMGRKGASRMAGRTHSAETRAKMSAAQSEPIAAARRAAKIAAALADPAVKARQGAAISKAHRRPEVRERKVAKLVAFWADPVKRLEASERAKLPARRQVAVDRAHAIAADPVARERVYGAEVSARKNATLRALWTPEKRQAARELAKAQWADPAKREAAAVAAKARSPAVQEAQFEALRAAWAAAVPTVRRKFMEEMMAFSRDANESSVPGLGFRGCHQPVPAKVDSHSTALPKKLTTAMVV